MSFQFNVDFPVIGTAKGVTIVRPEAPLREPHSLEENRSGSPGRSSTQKRKKKGREADLCEILKEAEAAKQRRFDKMFSFREESHADFKKMMQALLDKE